MGYILPVPMYQYDDYQERIIKPKQSPFTIEGVYRVTLDEKMDQPEDGGQHTNRGPQVKKNGKHLYPPNVHAAAEKIYAEVTGKGLHFSDSI
ncbi:hypothetical protein [Thalassobacillus pellis]|uniref:hypothetical protein n=1 Tax=Thalassobacillus pellis TaxID=748008 RepID=UPI00196204EE|nr:hypothetical protein [Thalassobacillus pellis]MBM7554001.1 hypothetical protein [Thalassobacillus pellis]